MDTRIRRLRAEAERLARGKLPSQVRYPDAFRRAAVVVARRHLAPGGSVTRLAGELGVSEPTLTKWLRPVAPPVLRPVAVTPPPPPTPPAGTGPTLTTPNGVRVTGLDCDGLIAVLRALA
jgi:transposase